MSVVITVAGKGLAAVGWQLRQIPNDAAQIDVRQVARVRYCEVTGTKCARDLTNATRQLVG